MRRVAVVALSVVAVGGAIGACKAGDPSDSPLVCGDGEEVFRGACVDPDARYEPAERLDTDNVVAFGDPLTVLQLPEPPKSGFRIVAPPRKVMPGGEIDTCVAWPYPKFTNHVVYAARLYTTPGLHHSNVITKIVEPEQGPNPYPKCHPGAADAFSQLPNTIPDVLFANSTQIEGTEKTSFPVGMGFKVDPTREIVTSIHYLNATAEEMTIEVAYDFFTMPESELVTEVAPFVLQVNDFLIPPHSTGDVGSECDVFGGTVVQMMPHTHKYLQRFDVSFVTDGVATPILEQGAFDTESDIHFYDPGLDLTNVQKMRFNCTFENTTDHDIVYGTGVGEAENEMCILFGYVYPVRQQFVGYADYQGEMCKSYQIGLFRP